MSKRLNALIVEDSEDDSILLVRELRRGVNELAYERVDTVEALERALDRQSWDIILADYALPSFNGLEALSILRARQLDVPLILVSGTIGEERSVAALKEGASDFIIKGNWSRLMPAVERELREATERRERRHAEAALRDTTQQLQYLFDNLDVVFFSIDVLHAHLLQVSPAFERLYGLPSQAMWDDPFIWLNAAHPDDRASAYALERQLREGQAIAHEYRIVQAGGESRWVEVKAKPTMAASGECVRIDGFVSDISERKQGQESLRQRVEELSTLFETTSALTLEEDPHALLELIVARARQLLHAQAGGIDLFDATAQELTAAVVQSETVPLNHRMRSGEGVVGRVAESRRALIVDDYRSWPGRTAAWETADVAAIIGVPMLYGGELVGVLTIFELGPSTRKFTPEDTRLLSLFAAQAAGVVHNARLLADTQRQLAYLQTLRTIDTAISSSFDLDFTLEILLNEAKYQLKADAVDILLLNPISHMLEFKAGLGFRTTALQHTRLRLGQGYAGRAALERQMVKVPDLRKAPGDLLRSPQLFGEAFAANLAPAEGAGGDSRGVSEDFLAYYAAPLATKGKLTGVLEVFHRAPLNADAQWLDFLEMLAGQTAIAIDGAMLFSGLQRSAAELSQAYDSTLEGWSHALDLRDKETKGHTMRVTDMTLRLAAQMRLSEAELTQVRRGALLHDIGKMGVPDSILLKPGPLTPDEWVIMRLHPIYAYDLLSPIAYLQPALDIPYCHHEKWDGSGYPRGLKGEQIPLTARIFAVVDVWDALCSDRPYRPAWPVEKVREYVRTEAGTHFDPRVVEMFLEMELELER